jgi:hypothetical protein
MWFRKEFTTGAEAFQVKGDGLGKQLAHFLL